MLRMGNFFAKNNDDKAFDEYMKTAEDLMAVMAAADARPTPPPVSATDRLQRNLERTVSESTARAEVLRQEIAAREAELADVLRAEEAARAALGNLTETELVADGEVLEWYKGRPITEDDLSAACGLALEAEMQEDDEDDIDPPGKPTEDGEFNGNIEGIDARVPVAALENRDVDWVDVTGWGVFLGHAIPVEIARQLAERVNFYHVHRSKLNGGKSDGK